MTFCLRSMLAGDPSFSSELKVHHSSDYDNGYSCHLPRGQTWRCDQVLYFDAYDPHRYLQSFGQKPEQGPFFRGYNLMLQWWMMKHLLKTHHPVNLDRRCRNDQFASHSWWLHLNHFKVASGQQFWMSILSGLREEDVQWSIDAVVTNDTIIRSRKLPFLVFAGLRGTRPYAPDRVLKQLGCK